MDYINNLAQQDSVNAYKNFKTDLALIEEQQLSYKDHLNKIETLIDQLSK